MIFFLNCIMSLPSSVSFTNIVKFFKDLVCFVHLKERTGLHWSLSRKFSSKFLVEVSYITTWLYFWNKWRCDIFLYETFPIYIFKPRMSLNFICSLLPTRYSFLWLNKIEIKNLHLSLQVLKLSLQHLYWHKLVV